MRDDSSNDPSNDPSNDSSVDSAAVKSGIWVFLTSCEKVL